MSEIGNILVMIGTIAVIIVIYIYVANTLARICLNYAINSREVLET